MQYETLKPLSYLDHINLQELKETTSWFQNHSTKPHQS